MSDDLLSVASTVRDIANAHARVGAPWRSAHPVRRPVRFTAPVTVPIPRMSFAGAMHVSVIDWQGIAQRMADAIGTDHNARAEFDFAESVSATIDTGDGGSRTIMCDDATRGGGR